MSRIKKKEKIYANIAGSIENNLETCRVHKALKEIFITIARKYDERAYTKDLVLVLVKMAIKNFSSS